MTTDSTRAPQHRASTAALAAVIALTAAAYWSVLDADFTLVDDDFYVFDNPRVLYGVSAESVAWAFTETGQANWIPLTLLSYILDAELFGAGPAGFHFTNLMLHLLGTVLAFYALFALTGTRWRSFIVAALFALHPVHVESVAWISSRKDVLSGVFFFLTLLLYARYVQQRTFARYLLVFGAFLLALTAKPVVMTLPFVLLLLDVWPLRRIDLGVPRAALPTIAEKGPLFGLTALFLGLTFVMQGTADAYGANLKYSLWDRMQNAAVAYAQYLLKSVWPVDLAPLYPLPLEPYPTATVAASALVILLVTLVVVVRPSKCPPALVGWLWFLGMMVPMAGFVQVGNQAYADRYTYLPYVGLSIALVWPAGEVLKCVSVPRPAVAAAAGVVLAALSVLTYRQALLWKDTETLFTHTLEVTEANAFAHNTLGLALERKGRVEEAVEQYNRAIEIVPGYFFAHLNLARAYEMTGDPAAAEAHYLEALRYKPDHPRANNNYGSLLARRGRPEEALPYFERALRTLPGNAMLNHNLGLALQDLGRHEEALDYLTRAVEAYPGFWPYGVTRALSLEASGRTDEAAALFDAAVENGVDRADIEARRQRVLGTPSP